ncbi:MAG: polysaccharide biosynthesis protein [Armatimonadetes bacterium]|nr:polysaccharide biosynthesis protein [Armatimonadota bacterium]
MSAQKSKNSDSQALRKPAALWKIVIRRIVFDILLANLALAVSWALIWNYPGENSVFEALLYGHLPITIVAGLLLVARRVYRVSARYVGLVDFVNVSVVSLGAAVVLAMTLRFWDQVPSEKGLIAVSVTFLLLFTFFWGFSRFFWKLRQFPTMWAAVTGMPRGERRVLIIGAGDAGNVVAQELQHEGKRKLALAGFVDDDPAKQGQTIHGVPVVGTVADLPALVGRLSISEIMIAVPSASGEQMRHIFDTASHTGVALRTLPSFADLHRESGRYLGQMRDFQVEDLLRRERRDSEIELEKGYLDGETVLITGGGGSIGSELARQVVKQHPASLILIGKGENSIFEIEQELKHAGHNMVQAVVCDVRNRDSLERVFAKYKPTIVFHAAAHKHVPLMELTPIEAVRNNVYGTMRVCETALRHAVKKFILVSTDKAVNPKNVMGASKRVAEMIVTAMADRSDTSFSAVRFGNVLGSRGSLVPILQKQIKVGGPITITHPEMTRFFMTIPEAAQLIVQAGAMGSHGEIFILDMGEAVKIVDLACDMIRMHGLVPGEDIEIKFTGIRPGEKLHEELSYEAEDLSPSEHAKINKVTSDRPVAWATLKDRLEALKALCDEGDVEATRAFLMDLAWAKNLPPVPLAEKE